MNGIIDIAQDTFAGFGNLKVLRMVANGLTAVRAGQLTGLSGLGELWLNNNPIERLEKNAFAAFADTIYALNLKGTALRIVDDGSINSIVIPRKSPTNGPFVVDTREAISLCATSPMNEIKCICDDGLIGEFEGYCEVPTTTATDTTATTVTDTTATTVTDTTATTVTGTTKSTTSRTITISPTSSEVPTAPVVTDSTEDPEAKLTTSPSGTADVDRQPETGKADKKGKKHEGKGKKHEGKGKGPKDPLARGQSAKDHTKKKNKKKGPKHAGLHLEALKASKDATSCA